MPRCVDCGTETPREEMYGPPDELRCRACVQRRFPTTNVPTARRPAVFLRWPPVTTFAVAAAVVITLLHWSHVAFVDDWLFADLHHVWEGQLWRLFTSVFPHLHILHLVFNLLFIWQFGKATEKWMGSLRFAGFFVATAVGPVAAELLAGGTGAGLSGVAFALFGFLYALRRDEEFAAELMTPRVVQALVFWFFLCIGLTYLHIMAIGNVAHGAGAAIGWLFGRAVLARRQVLATTVVSLLCVALAAATLYMPWNWRYDWYRGDQAFAARDYAQALSWYERADRIHPGNEDVEYNIELSRDRLKVQQEGGE